jgi:hypothetical protein
LIVITETLKLRWLILNNLIKISVKPDGWCAQALRCYEARGLASQAASSLLTMTSALNFSKDSNWRPILGLAVSAGVHGQRVCH